MAEKLSAIVAGHLCLDIIPQITGITPEAFRAAFMPGHLIDVGPVALSTGGPVSNTGLALHKLGVPTQLMGKIGDDLFGQAVTQLVSAYDPRLVGGMVVDPQASTSYTVVINPPGVDRIFLHCHGANDTFSADDVRYDLLDDVGLFHFGYPPLMKLMYADGGTQVSSLYRRAKATGVTTSLDMAFPGSSSVDAPWRRILALTLPHVDIFLPSIEEILVMLRRETYERMCAEAPDGDILPARHAGTARRHQRRTVGDGRQDRGPEARLPRHLSAHWPVKLFCRRWDAPGHLMSRPGPAGSCGRPASRSRWSARPDPGTRPSPAS